MSRFVLLTLALIAAFVTADVLQSHTTEEWLKLMKEASEKCKAEFSIPQDKLINYLETTTDDVTKKCRVVRCYDTAVLGSFTTLAEWKAKVSAFIHDFYSDKNGMKSKMLKIGSLCQEEKGSDDCSTMWQATKCFQTETNKLNISWEQSV